MLLRNILMTFFSQVVGMDVFVICVVLGIRAAIQRYLVKVVHHLVTKNTVALDVYVTVLRNEKDKDCPPTAENQIVCSSVYVVVQMTLRKNYFLPIVVIPT